VRRTATVFLFFIHQNQPTTDNTISSGRIQIMLCEMFTRI